MTTLPTHVVFESINPRFEVIVPRADAWGFHKAQAFESRGMFQQLRKLTRGLEVNLARKDPAKLSNDYYKSQHDVESRRLWDSGRSFDLVAVIWDNDPKQRSFAKRFTIWDYELCIHHLYAIGIGAYSGHDIINPELKDVQVWKLGQHYTHGNWSSGLNWATRDKTEYPDDVTA